jgi:hypothetical protein
LDDLGEPFPPRLNIDITERGFFGRKLLVNPHFLCTFKRMHKLFILRPLDLDDLIVLVEKGIMTDVLNGLSK